MSCENWRINLVALLDGSCDPGLAAPLRRHLDQCAACSEFYREQSDLTELLASPELQATPPPHLWYRIEDRLETTAESSRQSAWGRGFLFNPFAKLRYALLSCVLLAFISAALFQYRNDGTVDRLALAKLDVYELRVQGNPFLEQLGAPPNVDNPFFRLDTSNDNPFKKGNLQ